MIKLNYLFKKLIKKQYFLFAAEIKLRTIISFQLLKLKKKRTNTLYYKKNLYNTHLGIILLKVRTFAFALF